MGLAPLILLIGIPFLLFLITNMILNNYYVRILPITAPRSLGSSIALLNTISFTLFTVGIYGGILVSLKSFIASVLTFVVLQMFLYLTFSPFHLVVNRKLQKQDLVGAVVFGSLIFILVVLPLHLYLQINIITFGTRFIDVPKEAGWIIMPLIVVAPLFFIVNSFLVSRKLSGRNVQRMCKIHN